MDKDKLLPLVHFSRCVDTVHRLRCHEDQRDADLIILERDYVPKERVKLLVKAAQAFLGKLDEIAKATEGLFVVSHIHGISYNGPTWVKEKEALDEALAQLVEKP